jgi:hypothetical protein
VRVHLEAGADHVCLQVLDPRPTPCPSMAGEPSPQCCCGAGEAGRFCDQPTAATVPGSGDRFVVGWMVSVSRAGVNQWSLGQQVFTCSTGRSVESQIQRSTICADRPQLGCGQEMTGCIGRFCSLRPQSTVTGGTDVLVEPEQVGRVVSVLDGD